MARGWYEKASRETKSVPGRYTSADTMQVAHYCEVPSDNEKPVPRAVLRRYTESLQCNLERLVMSGLMVYTKHFIDEAANNDATRLCRDKRPDAGGLEANLANANPSADRGGEACLSPCDACRAVAQASSSPEMIQALKDAMASALQAGSFSKTAP